MAKILHSLLASLWLRGRGGGVSRNWRDLGEPRSGKDAGVPAGSLSPPPLSPPDACHTLPAAPYRRKLRSQPEPS